MSFLLDTDTILANLKGNPGVSRRVTQCTGQLYCSVLSMTEVELILAHPRTPLHLTQVYFGFLPQVTPLSVDVRIAQEAARVGADFRIRGKRPPRAVDLVIAATALVHGLTLVTRSPAVFAGVSGLPVVDWTLP